MCLVYGILIIINIYKLLHIFTNYFSLFFHTHTCYLGKIFWLQFMLYAEVVWKINDGMEMSEVYVRVHSKRKAKTMRNKIAWCWFLYFKRICSLQNAWWNGVYLHTHVEIQVKPYQERTVTATLFRFSDISIKYYIIFIYLYCSTVSFSSIFRKQSKLNFCIYKSKVYITHTVCAYLQYGTFVVCCQQYGWLLIEIWVFFNKLFYFIWVFYVWTT